MRYYLERKIKKSDFGNSVGTEKNREYMILVMEKFRKIVMEFEHKFIIW